MITTITIKKNDKKYRDKSVLYIYMDFQYTRL